MALHRTYYDYLPYTDFIEDPALWNAHTLHLQSLQKRMVVKIKEQSEGDEFSALIFNSRSKKMLLPPFNFSKAPAGDNERPNPEEMAREVFDRGHRFIENAQSDETFKKRHGHGHEIASAAVLRIGKPDHFGFLAIIFIYYKQPHGFTREERKKLAAIAEELSEELKPAWSFYRFERVVHIGQELFLHLNNSRKLFEKLVDLVGDILDPGHFFSLAQFVGFGRTTNLHYRVPGKLNVKKTRKLTPLCEKVIKEGHPLLIRHYSGEKPGFKLNAEIVDSGAGIPESLIFVPVLFRERVLGVLTVQHIVPNAYDVEDLQIMEMLANHLASALNSIRLSKNQETINATAEKMTGALSQKGGLQSIVKVARESTLADIVSLYPFAEEQKGRSRFILPPIRAGKYRDKSFKDPIEVRQEDLSNKVLKWESPLFCRNVHKPDPEDSRQASFPTPFQKREKVVSVAIFPLCLNEMTLGVLYLNFRYLQPFDIPQRLLIKGLAFQATIAIFHERIFDEQEKRRRHELAILKHIDETLLRSESLDERLKNILEGANEVIQADGASILLKHSDPLKKDKLWIPSAIGLGQEKVEGSEFDISGKLGISVWAFNTGQHVRVNDIKKDPEWGPRFIGKRGSIYAEMDIPLKSGEHVFGVLNFERRKKLPFTDKDLEFAITLAGQVALAIKLAQESDGKDRFHSLVSELNREIASELEIENLLRTILIRAIEQTNAKSGVLLFYNEQRDDLEIIMEHGDVDNHKGERISMGRGIVGVAAKTKELQNIDPEEPRWKGVFLPYAKGSRSALAVPLLEMPEGSLLGVLNIESPVLNQFQQNEVKLVQALASLAVVALKNSKRYQEVKTGKERLEAMQKLTGDIIGQTDDPDQVMIQAVQYAMKFTESDFADLDFYENGKIVRYFIGEKGREVEVRQAKTKKPPERGIMKHVADTRQPYRTTGKASEDPLYKGVPEVWSEMAVPLKEKNRLIGVLNVDRLEGKPYILEDQLVLQVFADQCVIAIQNAKGVQRLRFLLNLGKEMARLKEDHSQAWNAAAKYLGEHLHCLAYGRVFDWELENYKLVVNEDTHSSVQKIVESGPSLNQIARKNRKIQVVHDCRDPKDPNAMYTQFEDRSIRTVMVAPVAFDEENYFGNLIVCHAEANHFEDEPTHSLLGQVTTLLAITLHRLDKLSQEKHLLVEKAQAEIMTTLGEASYSLAHRLGNDLGLIKSYVNYIRAELVNNHFSNTKVDQMLDNIVQDTRVVLDLYDKITKEMHQENKEQSFQRIEIGDIIDYFQNQPKHRRREMQVPNRNLAVWAIRTDVEGILQNLIENAVGATAADGRISLRIWDHEPYVEISVIDDGAGIEPKNLKKIFNFLFSTKGSSGFGLWSALRKAKRNKGDLSVTSQPGKGATFTLSLYNYEHRLEGGFD